jgi:hypothetical protein
MSCFPSSRARDAARALRSLLMTGAKFNWQFSDGAGKL